MTPTPQPVATPSPALSPTALSQHLQAGTPSLPLAPQQGALTIQAFEGTGREIAALTAAAGVYDLGYQSFLRISGSDRVRWLNGMVTNTIQSLDEGRGNYSFLLNAQGRIQGDATIYRFPDHILLQTERSQIARLTSHLDRFIIMDDVELNELDAAATSIGIAGPNAARILDKLGLTPPEENTFIAAKLLNVGITLVHAYSPVVPRFEIWLPAASVAEIWTALINAGAIPCGLVATTALRVLEATPLYGIDILDKHLPQETAQTRALNFNKGCYLGQEIVERIRSRATVHRTLRQFSLTGPAAALEAGHTIALSAEGAQQNPAGELSSVARYHLPAFTGALALGFIRTEAIDRKLPITYSDGTATPLDKPPSLQE